MPKAVYGLPELYREHISKASLVANPGCYPTSALLGLHPALKHGLVETKDMIIDAKSGTTGAGRKAAVGTLFLRSLGHLPGLQTWAGTGTRRR